MAKEEERKTTRVPYRGLQIDIIVEDRELAPNFEPVIKSARQSTSLPSRLGKELLEDTV